MQLFFPIFLIKDDWFGVLHHMAGEYEWIDGECQHGPLVASETDKTYLDKNSKAMEAVRKVILDQRFVKSLYHYVTFRYTEYYALLLQCVYNNINILILIINIYVIIEYTLLII